MPIPSTVADLSATASSNYPQGAEGVNQLDDYHRALAAIVRQVSDAKANTSHTHTASNISDASPNGRSVLTAADYAAMRALLGLVIGTDIQAYDADIPTVLASQAEMEAGTEVALRSMSPLRVKQAIQALGAGLQTSDFTGSNQSLSANGYQKLPGGLIVQWGSCTSAFSPVSVTFPITFPSACYVVILGGKDISGTIYQCSANSVSASGFNAYNGSTTLNNFYVAIGR